MRKYNVEMLLDWNDESPIMAGRKQIGNIENLRFVKDDLYGDVTLYERVGSMYKMMLTFCSSCLGEGLRTRLIDNDEYRGGDARFFGYFFPEKISFTDQRMEL